MMLFFMFFFKRKTAYEMRIRDWSSDVCSSDLVDRHAETDRVVAHGVGRRPVVVDAVGENVQHGAAGGEGRGEAERDGGLDRLADVGHAPARGGDLYRDLTRGDRKSTRLNSSH